VATFTPTPQEVAAATAAGLSPPTTQAQETIDKALEAKVAAQGLTGATGAAASGSTAPSTPFQLPGATGAAGVGVTVPSDLKNIEIPYAARGQQAFGRTPAGATIGANGTASLTYAQIVAAFRDLSPAQRADIQRNLYQGGFYPSGSIPTYDGTFKTADLGALEQAAGAAFQTGIPLTTYLLHGAQAGNFESEMTAYKADIQAAEQRAQAATAPSVTLTDPNVVRQAFAVAMEAMGAGAPTPDAEAAFVGHFRDAEISAVQSAGEAQKQGYLDAVPTLQSAERDLQQGNLQGAQIAAAQPGPVTVATKSMPNLDAEARAQAQTDNPGAYYSNQMSLLGGIIHNALNGTDTFQTRPESPSQTAPVGASLGQPFQGM
jgi:hypothetical protein